MLEYTSLPEVKGYGSDTTRVLDNGTSVEGVHVICWNGLVLHLYRFVYVYVCVCVHVCVRACVCVCMYSNIG